MSSMSSVSSVSSVVSLTPALVLLRIRLTEEADEASKGTESRLGYGRTPKDLYGVGGEISSRHTGPSPAPGSERHRLCDSFEVELNGASLRPKQGGCTVVYLRQKPTAANAPRPLS